MDEIEKFDIPHPEKWMFDVIPKVNISKEIRYFIFQEPGENQQIHAICLKCKYEWVADYNPDEEIICPRHKEGLSR